MRPPHTWPGALRPSSARAWRRGVASCSSCVTYHGAADNRCARLRAVAHGCQVLLSGATYELVRDLLPSGVTLRDLGTHRLKDLTRPEQVYQVVAPDLPGEFPRSRRWTGSDTTCRCSPRRSSGASARSKQCGSGCWSLTRAC
jgi:hypothetical protein